MSREREKKPNWVGLVLFLLFFMPEVVIPLAICAGIGYLVFMLAKNQRITAPDKKTTYTRDPSTLDDCPNQKFCFHKDKGEHHVARGKEIDPWDRPDIDISKYQRRR